MLLCTVTVYNNDTPGIDILDFRINLSPIQTYINDIFFVKLVYLNNILFFVKRKIQRSF